MTNNVEIAIDKEDDETRYESLAPGQSVAIDDTTIRILRTNAPAYTPLEELAAEVSGMLCLDAMVADDLEAVEVFASRTALLGARRRLDRNGYDVEIDRDHEPMRLLVYQDDTVNESTA
ncbi:hypothetical protein [Natrinema pallidum]|uniref:hypothetical protein n=1 Tax=Natrinema pallidum TaxID=69527 RepID=UPI0037522652